MKWLLYIIFVIVYEKFVVKVFELNVIDYILKFFEKECIN